MEGASGRATEEGSDKHEMLSVQNKILSKAKRCSVICEECGSRRKAEQEDLTR